MSAKSSQKIKSQPLVRWQRITPQSCLGFLIVALAVIFCGYLGYERVTRTVSELPITNGPSVESWLPGDNQEIVLDGEIKITFSNMMNIEATKRAFSLLDSNQQRVPGELIMEQYSNELRFIPAHLLSPNQTYQILITTEAKDYKDNPLANVFIGTIHTTDRLFGCMVYPFDGASDVDLGAPIRVIFDRPVVSIGFSNQQTVSENILLIDPPTPGTGTWESESVYRFIPEKPLVSGTKYSITANAAAVNQLNLNTTLLTQDVQWQFQTVSPSIKSIHGVRSGEAASKNDRINFFRSGGEYRSTVLFPTDLIILEFEQPMNSEMTAQYVTVVDSDSNPVAVGLTWDPEFKNLTIDPGKAFQMGQKYYLTVAAGALALDGGRIQAELTAVLNMLPFPDISSVVPKHEEASGKYYTKYTIGFNTDMDRNNWAEKVTFNPPLTSSSEPYYDENSNTLTFYGLAPSTDYVVDIWPGLKDIYSNVTSKHYQTFFENGPIPPAAEIDLPDREPIIYRTGGPFEFYTYYVNVNSVTYSLYKITRDQFINFSKMTKDFEDFVPTSDQLVWQQSEPTLGQPNEEFHKKITFSGVGGAPLEPGYYYLNISSDMPQSSGKSQNGRLLAVLDANLTLKLGALDSLIWLTDLTTGEPLPNIHVALYRDSGQLMGEGDTDSSGVARIRYLQPFDPKALYYAVPTERHAIAISNWRIGYSDYDQISPYYFGETADKPMVYLYTERPVYRPEQTVYFKGIVRLKNDFSYSLPGQNQVSLVEIIIEDYSAKEVSHLYLPLSAYGTFNGSFQLQKNALLGNYTIKALVRTELIEKISFNVAEYRPQTFQLDLTTSQQNMLAGGSISAALQARYLAGGFVSDAKVNLSVGATPYFFTPSDSTFSGYSFSEEETAQQLQAMYPNEIGNFDLSTDSEGKSAIDLPTMLNPGIGHEVTVSATVTDIAGSTVIDHSTVYIHPSEYYLGLRPQFNALDYQQEQTVDVVVLDWNQKPVANYPLTLELLQEHWYRLDREVDGTRIPDFSSDTETIQNFPITTDANGRSTIKFTPPRGGVYEIRGAITDTKNNIARASVKFLVNEPSTYISWKMGPYQNVTVVTDKEEYAVGETANIAINTPFQGPMYALITVERASVRDAKVILLENNNTNLSIPISRDLAPNVFISVVVVKGVDESLSRPGYALGLAKIKVDRDEQELVIDLQPPPQAMPGQDLNLNIFTHNKVGQPVQAEISLAVTDLAALLNKAPNTPPILEAFYSQQSMQVATFTPLALSAEEYNYRRENNLLTGESMGGGNPLKGDGVIGVLRLREEFPDTAYWAPVIETNQQGEASITIHLPDNATTWLIEARGITLNDTLVGQSSTKLVSTRPLLISPQTPYFFVGGDETHIGALIHNNSDQAMQGTISLALEKGARLLNGTAEQTFTVAAQDILAVEWPLAIDNDSDRVDMIFSANAGEFSDSTRPPQGTLDLHGIPILKYTFPNTYNFSGILTNAAETAYYEINGIPPFPTGKDLIIEIAPSLWGGMQNSIQYIASSSIGGTEQIVSRFLPKLTLVRYLDHLGLSEKYVDENFRQQINADLNELAQVQNPDGGWGWLEYQESDDLATAYVVVGLKTAKEAGYNIFENEFGRAIDYLVKSVQPTTNLHTTQQLNRQAFILYVLSEVDQLKESDAVKLYDQRDRLSIYSKAFLAMALYSVNPSNPRLKELAAELERSAIQSNTGVHWQEVVADGANWNTDTRTTSIVLNTLIRIRPRHKLIDKTVLWLISNRIDGRWQSSQEIAWAIRSLTEWAKLREEAQPSFKYTVDFNGQELSQASVNPNDLEKVNTLSVGNNEFLTGQANRLQLRRTDGPGSLYYSAYLRLFSTIETITPIEQGISIAREYFRQEDLDSPVTQARVGDVILARLTINVPQDLDYVVIKEPLPAGMEASIWTPNELYNDYLNSIGWNDIFAETGINERFLHTAELHNDKIVIYASKLSAGSYEYTYLLRASWSGKFHVLPPFAQEYYNPSIFGQGSGSIFEIIPY